VESSAGGLISAALVAVPGASAYFRGGIVIYTLDGTKDVLTGGPPLAAHVRSSTEPFVTWLVASGAAKLTADSGLAETGASGPSGNPYGDPAGHAWVAVRPPDGATRTQHLLTDSADRAANMEAFAAAGLALLLDALG
jgi:nicotinamide-nucleotide amidase